MITNWRIVKSFRYAFRGLIRVFKTELSFRLQVLAALGVLILLFVFPLKAWEIIMIILLTGLVLILELINSIFERLVDAFKPRLHPIVRDIKDIMAAAVLLSSIVALVIGLIIFWPHLGALIVKLI